MFVCLLVWYRALNSTPIDGRHFTAFLSKMSLRSRYLKFKRQFGTKLLPNRPYKGRGEKVDGIGKKFEIKESSAEGG